MSTIQLNLVTVRATIKAAEETSGRSADAVTLVAVSKRHDATSVRQAIAAGQMVFGENRVQEAQEKFPGIKLDFPAIRLHLIGPLQSNKTRDAVELFDVIETLDRTKLAVALVRERERSGKCPDLLIQINTGEEQQKAGILPADADDFIKACREEHHLPVCGLMCIPPIDEEPAMHFALLAEMARRHGLDRLSMGMSADYEIAIKLGATHIRVGTAIFGARDA
jgi:hypothetical protein